ncbi:MAG: HAMP domain-containing protein [Desulfovibrionaceae bacterium]|jgi:signal transduction histidine kinase|nr:HAMP domain-containing protein [Desulfovibrionaceae bacterium]
MRVGFRLGLISALLVCLLVACAFTAIWLYSAAYRDQIAKDSLLLAERIVKRTQANIDVFRQDMDLFAVATGLGDKIQRRGDFRELGPLLRKTFLDYFELRRGDRIYEEVSVADVNGRQVASSTGRDHPEIAGQAWWREVLATGQCLAPLAYREHTDTYGVVLASALRNGQGETTGVIWAVLSVTALVRDTGFRTKQYPSTFIELINEQGRLLYSSRLFRYLEDRSREPFFKGLGREPEVRQINLNGRDRLLVSYPFTGDGSAAALGWRLIISQRMSEVMGTGYRLRNGLLVATLGVLLLAGGLSFLLARNITDRLGRLAVAATAFGNGVLDQRAVVAGRDEIAQLAATFNDMAANLERSTEELHQEIEERERAEASLAAQTEKLKRSNEELEQFAYVASHDLQEPLRIIVSYLQLIERRYQDKMDEDGGRFIQATINGAERMRSLIRGLLTYSRVHTKGQAFGSVDLNAVLDEALENLGQAILESGARVERADLPRIYGDHSQMVQLFQNLIGNGIKFQPAGRSPVITVGAAKGEGSSWELTVGDNGIGIEPQYAGRIFGLFQRLHSRGQYEGTGIGLSVCKRIVERHYGRIWLESSPGQGTSFHFTLTQGG